LYEFGSKNPKFFDDAKDERLAGKIAEEIQY
jgi:hypothetical protein